MSESIQEYRFINPPEPVMDLKVTQMDEFLEFFSEIITVTHRTNFFKLFWFTQGRVDALIDFQTFRIEAPSILFISDRQVFSLTNFSEIEGYGLFFLPQFLPHSFYETLDVPFMELYTTNPISDFDAYEERSISSILDHMLKEQGRENTISSEGILKHLLSALLLYIRRIKAKAEIQKYPLTEDRKLYKRFLLLLEENFRESREAYVFAELLHITPKRLNQITQKAAGLNATNIIINRIILEAKRQLLHTTQSIKEIGYNLGFREASNFTKYFKKYETISPKEFRMLHS